ncbi:hypothetical protein RHYG_00016 [Rhizobium phage RR1-B]|uniref:hypothetical protein n=1 Tax=Rhizobium phage RR1-B TaxID=929834 RepID=UPI0003427A73|nr:MULTISPECIES: hypothetical protein [Rhizobium/Agrobacterium group]YP_008129830.1 hypothetical protein RHYG_00016 [Rhizobium phage RR1-B]AGN38685.1 hypothetical protein RHYG_00016 [Rhizobium phage RR1-B]CAD7023064.1 hypothetical protein RP007_00077 [Rhizobium sp. P007]
MIKGIPSSFAQGYAVCSPDGVLLPHSFRRTKEDAIASVFTDPVTKDAHWQAAEEQGMTVEFVYARIFPPRFIASSVLAAMAAKEMEGAE